MYDVWAEDLSASGTLYSYLFSRTSGREFFESSNGLSVISSSFTPTLGLQGLVLKQVADRYVSKAKLVQVQVLHLDQGKIAVQSPRRVQVGAGLPLLPHPQQSRHRGTERGAVYRVIT
jgi:hypothetical protein